MTASMPQIEPNKGNYYHSNPFIFYNELTGRDEKMYAEDWRKGWVKTGELIHANALPVIRVYHPKDKLQPWKGYLIRPCYLKNKNNEYILNDKNQKVVVAVSPIFDHTKLPLEIKKVIVETITHPDGTKTENTREEIETCHPEPVLTKPLHDDAVQSDGKESKKNEVG